MIDVAGVPAIGLLTDRLDRLLDRGGDPLGKFGRESGPLAEHLDEAEKARRALVVETEAELHRHGTAAGQERGFSVAHVIEERQAARALVGPHVPH